jgi:hypothetical protein
MIMGPIHRPNQGFGWARMAPMKAASDNEPDGNANVPVNQGKFYQQNLLLRKYPR